MGVAERVLTLRDLNRATLARQLLLERRRLAPTAVIERLVGMKAQWPAAPHVGNWTRTTSFRREVLERELARAAVVKATAMRQTLHLVTRRDYALLRAALSETNFPWESAQAKRLAPSVRTLAMAGQVTTEEALVHLEREHGLTGIDAQWLTCCTITRRRSGARVPRADSSSPRSRGRTSRSRRAPRSFVATWRRSVPRRAGTSSRGA